MTNEMNNNVLESEATEVEETAIANCETDAVEPIETNEGSYPYDGNADNNEKYGVSKGEAALVAGGTALLVVAIYEGGKRVFKWAKGKYNNWKAKKEAVKKMKAELEMNDDGISDDTESEDDE